MAFNNAECLAAADLGRCYFEAVAVLTNVYRVIVLANIDGVTVLAVLTCPVPGAVAVIVRTDDVIAIPRLTRGHHAALVRVLAAF